MRKFESVKEYFSSQPAEVRMLLEEMRETIRQAAPRAEEVISYNIPAFKQNGILVYYAAHKQHIGFYPTSSGIRNFEKELVGYTTSKGAVQFPFNKPIPKTLVKKIVKFRVKENLEKSKKVKDK
jgi:uncharacterized protein YdhG (YjbR/CyaY superfamily)